MRPIAQLAAALATLVLTACGNDLVTTTCCSAGAPSLRVVNAFTGPVDVLVDGTIALSGVEAGTVATASPSAGSHVVLLRPTGSAAAASRTVTTTSGGVSTLAAVRAASGAVTTAILDDTNSVVPTGATKVRVLHFAPNAGTLQVFRTQPDFGTPISWQFPFTYQADPTSLSAPFYQSTVGTWEIRVWQAPADASGWATAPVKVVIPLASGEKRTVIILDKAGGGVRVELL